MVRALLIDRTAVIDAEWARPARANSMATHLNLEPAVAAGRAVAAVSRLPASHRPTRSARSLASTPAIADFKRWAAAAIACRMQATAKVQSKSTGAQQKRQPFCRFAPIYLTFGIMYTNIFRGSPRGGCDASRRHA